MSISSLRSKFESLAASNNGAADIAPRSRSRNGSGAGIVKVGGVKLNGLGIEAGPSSISSGTVVSG